LKADPLIACPDCDLLQREIPLPRGGMASCLRCGAVLYHSARGGLEHAVALTVCGMILYVIANVLPIATLDLGTRDAQTTLAGTVVAMMDQGQLAVAALVAFTTLVAPAVELFAMSYLVVPLWLGSCPPHLAIAFRIAPFGRAWALVDVFMLAVAVALIKLSDLATVVPGPALLAYAGLIVTLTAVGLAFDPREIWLHAEACRAGEPRARVP
jgi:paraquat-inducible protein A